MTNMNLYAYEQHLKNTNPDKRNLYGAYYTPEPIVAYMLDMVERLLQDEFSDTLEEAKILDPACGTGIFGKHVLMRTHKPENLFCFELDEQAAKIASKHLDNVYCTNTLDMQLGMFMSDADRRKANSYDVIIGNPPYARMRPFIDMSEYKTETDGVTPLQERSYNCLYCGYTQFFRYAQTHLNAHGILSFITNNNYLDAIVLRGMRASLMRTFNKIFILNLNGSTNRLPTGVDENVFDIKQGVSIFTGIKTDTDEHTVWYRSLEGSRENKLASLQGEYERLDVNGEHNLTPPQGEYEKLYVSREHNPAPLQSEYERLDVSGEYAYFVPTYESDTYTKGVSLDTIFPARIAGMKTGNDKVLLKETRADMEKFIGELRSGAIKDFPYNPRDLQKPVRIAQLQVYPMDCMWTCLDLLEGKRHELVKAFEYAGNIGMLCTRTSKEYVPPFITQLPATSRSLSGFANVTYIAPQYVWKDGEWVHNLGVDWGEPLDVFDYVYGVLWDPAYTKVHEQALCRNYPKVPEPDKDFERYRAFGNTLRRIHMGQGAGQGAGQGTGQGAGQEAAPLVLHGEDMRLQGIKLKDDRLYLNRDTWIEGVSKEVWDCRIGGYKVIEHYLKKRSCLTNFEHLCDMVGIVSAHVEAVREYTRNFVA